MAEKTYRPVKPTQPRLPKQSPHVPSSKSPHPATDQFEKLWKRLGGSKGKKLPK
jgi:hypothetical protein